MEFFFSINIYPTKKVSKIQTTWCVTYKDNIVRTSSNTKGVTIFVLEIYIIILKRNKTIHDLHFKFNNGIHIVVLSRDYYCVDFKR